MLFLIKKSTSLQKEETINSYNLRELTKDNALTIANYILSMKNEINLSDN